MTESLTTVETQRLILRKPRPEDAEAIFARYASDAEVTRYLSWPRHRSLDDTHAFLQFSETEWARAAVGPYLIESSATGVLLGATGLRFETPRRAETGYVLARDAWGRGYATEALTAVVAIGRRVGLVRLQAMCHPEHPASIRVLEKCGFQREGVLRRYADFPNLEPGGACDVVSHGLILDGSEASKPPAGEATPEANKRLLRLYYEKVVSGGRIDEIAGFVSPDYVEVHGGVRHCLGLEGARAHVRGVRETYPDLRLTVGRQIAEGEWVASLVTMRGTHQGRWMGIEPTGKRVEVTAVNIDRVVGGRIVEHGGAANLLEPLLEIGAVRIAADAD